MLDGVREALFHNLHFKVLSVLLAVAAWVYVQSDEVHDATVNARLTWSLPSQLVSADALPTSVTLNVRGTRAATRRVRDANLEIPIDVSGSSVGDQYLELANFAGGVLPQSIELLGVSPSSVRFYLDEMASRKVGIEPALVGEPSADHLIEQVILTPSVVEVRGPRAVVENLKEVATAPIDVSELSEETHIEVVLDLPRTVRLAPSQTPPRARVVVSPRNEERVIDEVPVNLWNATMDWASAQPTVTVTLEGPSGLLRALEADEVAAFVHLPDNPTQPSYEAPYGPTEGVRLRVLHPGGDAVKVVRVEPARVAVVRQ